MPPINLSINAPSIFIDSHMAGGEGGGGAVAQSVERATPGEEITGSIPSVVARSLLVGSMSV